MKTNRLKDRKTRCDWCLSGNDLYIDYHDSEWGVPVHDDQKQFEFLILEGAQAGLSWSTVLNKREGLDNPDVSLEGEMKVDPGVSITDVLYINVITNVPVSTDSIVISVFANSPCVRFPSVTISPTAHACLLYTSPSPRDQRGSRMPSSA